MQTTATSHRKRTRQQQQKPQEKQEVPTTTATTATYHSGHDKGPGQEVEILPVGAANAHIRHEIVDTIDVVALEVAQNLV